jgi:alpha-galactosidase
MYLRPSLVAFASCALALDNGVGRTPALGWSSWNTFGPAVSDALIRETADAMAANGLLDAGYEYINLDDGWAIGRDNVTGVIIPDPALFPFGMKPLIDYVHSKGLKFGIYTARGSLTCCGRPGSDMHEIIDAQTYALWGVDYLKGASIGTTAL